MLSSAPSTTEQSTPGAVSVPGTGQGIVSTLDQDSCLDTVIIGGDDIDGSNTVPDGDPVTAHVVDESDDPAALREEIRQLRREREAQQTMIVHASARVLVTSNDEGCTGRRYLLVAAGLLLFVVLLAVLLGVLLPKSAGSVPVTGTVTTTLPPSTPPTKSPTELDLAPLIESAYVRKGWTMPSDPLSPQQRALRWLEGNTNILSYPDWKILQRYVLAVFFYSTGGESWRDNSGWLSDADECLWYSDSVPPPCNEANNFTNLSLQYESLNGTIPKEVVVLEKLESFRLEINQLEGPSILKHLSRLTTLTFVSLQNNLLGGSLPTELARLTGVTSLSLATNRFTGTVPTNLFQMTSLRYLSLFENMLTGTFTCPDLIVDCRLSCFNRSNPEPCRSMP